MTKAKANDKMHEPLTSGLASVGVSVRGTFRARLNFCVPPPEPQAATTMLRNPYGLS